MKKYYRLVYIIISMFLVVSLCGCTELDKLKEVEAPPVPTPTEKPEAVGIPEPTNEPLQYYTDSAAIHIRCNTQKQEYVDPRDGSKIIMTVYVCSPFVTIEGNDEASENINSFISALDESFYTGDDYGAGKGHAADINYYNSIAEDNFTYLAQTGREDELVPVSIERLYTVTRADSHAIRIDFSNIFNAGEEQTDSYYYCFDTETGDSLSVELYNEFYEPEDYSYESNPAISIKKLADTDDNTHSILDLLTLDEEGENYIICFDDDIRDFRLCYAVYNPEDDSFSPGTELWFCSCPAGNALQLRADISGEIPRLMFSCSPAEGETIINVIMLETVTGNVMLQNAANLHAVG